MPLLSLLPYVGVIGLLLAIFLYGRKSGEQTGRIAAAEAGEKQTEENNRVLKNQRDNDVHTADDALRVLDQKRDAGKWTTLP